MLIELILAKRFPKIPIDCNTVMAVLAAGEYANVNRDARDGNIDALCLMHAIDSHLKDRLCPAKRAAVTFIYREYRREKLLSLARTSDAYRVSPSVRAGAPTAQTQEDSNEQAC